MKRRSFIQGALAVIAATVVAKALPAAPKPKPQMLTGQRWALDPDCDKTRVYYMNRFQVGDCVRFYPSKQTAWITSVKDAV